MREKNTSPEAVKEKRTGGQKVSLVVNIILAVALVIAALCAYVSFVSKSGNGVPNILGVEVFSVQTDSMYPTLKPGDLIIDKAVKDPSKLRVGDIITYWTVIDGQRVLNTHTIYNIYDGGDYLIFETKGDNNNVVDSLTVHESEVVGKYSTRIGGVGKALDFLQTSKGFLICIVIPVALFFLFHLVQFFRTLFEYQSVKNRLKFQMELDAREAAQETEKPERKQESAAEVAPPAAQKDAPPAQDRAAIEAELREKLKAEMMQELREEMRKNAEKEAAAKETAEKKTDE